MACGKPTVSTALGEAPYYLEGEKSGFLATNIEDFTDRMYALAVNPSLRRQMGHEARRQAEQKYNLEKTRGDLYNIIFNGL